MEAKQMILSEAEQAPSPEPMVPEKRSEPQPHLDELCRNLLDPQVRSELAKLGIQINLSENLQPTGNGEHDANEAGQLSQALSEVKNFALHIGGIERLKEMVNMLISLKE